MFQGYNKYDERRVHLEIIPLLSIGMFESIVMVFIGWDLFKAGRKIVTIQKIKSIIVFKLSISWEEPFLTPTGLLS